MGLGGCQRRRKPSPPTPTPLSSHRRGRRLLSMKTQLLRASHTTLAVLHAAPVEQPITAAAILNPTRLCRLRHVSGGFRHTFSIPTTASTFTLSRCRMSRRKMSTYESCVWTPQQMDTWIAGNASIITSDPYSTKLMMPESDSFQPCPGRNGSERPECGRPHQHHRRPHLWSLAYPVLHSRGRQHRKKSG